MCSENKEESIDKEESTDKEQSENLSPVLPFEGDEEVKEEKGSKIITPKKLLTRLPILLAQIKARNNSHQFKNKMKQISHLLHQHNKITKKVHNNFNNGRKYNNGIKI